MIGPIFAIERFEIMTALALIIAMTANAVGGQKGFALFERRKWFFSTSRRDTPLCHDEQKRKEGKGSHGTIHSFISVRRCPPSLDWGTSTTGAKTFDFEP